MRSFGRLSFLLSAPLAGALLCGAAPTDIIGQQVPLQIEIRTQLDFSRAAVGSGGGLRIDPRSGVRTQTGDIVDLGGGGFAGKVMVTGEPGRQIRVDMPGSIILHGSEGGEIEVRSLRTDLPTAPHLDVGGTLEFAFGGELYVSGNISGNFRGRIPITVEYD